MLTSVIYAALAALLIAWLVFRVVKLRWQYRLPHGDGGHKDLQLAIATHANAVETIPIALLLLFSLEINDGNLLVVHGFGMILLLGRLIHARSLLSDQLKGRVFGMQLTLAVIIGLAITNLGYLIYYHMLSV